MTEKQKKLIFRLATAAGVIFLLWVLVKYGLPLLMPFVIALLVARGQEKAVGWLTRRRWNRALAAALCTLAVYGAALCLAALIVWRVGFELSGLLTRLPTVIASLPDTTSGLQETLRHFIASTPPELQSFLSNTMDRLINEGVSVPQEVYSRLLGALSGAAGSLPSIFLFIVTSVLSTFFLSADFGTVMAFIKRQFPEKWHEKLLRTKDGLSKTLAKWLRAQLMLMGITFLELTLGLFVLGIDYPVLFAALIALVDALPILGSGTVLIPWAAFLLLTGQTRLGVSLIILYGAVSIIRGVIEPKFVGSQIGLHPLATLLSMYVGFCTFGLPGMIILPIILITLLQLNSWGYIAPAFK